MNPDEFAAKISQSNQPVVVDFWAPWCAPCRMTKPILEKLAYEFQGKVEFLEVNADESQELLKEYGVMGIPTVLAFSKGEQAGRLVGARGEADYRAVFQALAEGTEVSVPMPPMQRWLRLGGGLLLIIYAISTQSWLFLGLGALVVFLGVYDRCPIWQAISSRLRRGKKALD